MLPLLRHKRYSTVDLPSRRLEIPLALVTPWTEGDTMNWFLCTPGIRTGEGRSIPGKIPGDGRTYCPLCRDTIRMRFVGLPRHRRWGRPSLYLSWPTGTKRCLIGEAKESHKINKAMDSALDDTLESRRMSPSERALPSRRLPRRAAR